jgi:hypothetical protein
MLDSNSVIKVKAGLRKRWRALLYLIFALARNPANFVAFVLIPLSAIGMKEA